MGDEGLCLAVTLTVHGLAWFDFD